MFLGAVANHRQRKAEKEPKKEYGINSSFDWLDLKDVLKDLDEEVSNETPPSVFEGLVAKVSTEVSAEEGVDEEAALVERAHNSMTLVPQGTLPIVYTSDETPVGAETMKKFFDQTSRMLMNKSNQLVIIEASRVNDNALYKQSMEFQRDILEYQFQIERKYGVNILGRIQHIYPDDMELIDAAQDFMCAAMRAYVEMIKLKCAQDFARIRGASKSAPLLKSTGLMTRNQLLEFFECINATMSLPEVTARLRAEWAATKDFQKVGKVTIEIQHRALELVGFTKECGVENLNRISDNFKGDQTIFSKFQSFQICAETYTKAATLDEAAYAKFINDIPYNMRKVPHLYYVHKAVDHQRQQMAAMQARAQGGMSNDPQLNEKQRQIMSLMTSEEGRIKINSLAERMTARKGIVEAEIKDWDSAQLKQYFDEFSSSEVTTILSESGDDVLKKLDTFITMDDTNLDKVMKMNSVFAKDARDHGGELMKALREAKGESIHITKAMGALGSMSRLFSTGAQMPHPGGHGGHDHSHGHDHGHGGHQHGPGCRHHQGPPVEKAPDVVTGKADSMER
jgi:hypothetical protein